MARKSPPRHVQGINTSADGQSAYADGSIPLLSASTLLTQYEMGLITTSCACVLMFDALSAQMRTQPTDW